MPWIQQWPIHALYHSRKCLLCSDFSLLFVLQDCIFPFSTIIIEWKLLSCVALEKQQKAWLTPALLGWCMAAEESVEAHVARHCWGSDSPADLQSQPATHRNQIPALRLTTSPSQYFGSVYLSLQDFWGHCFHIQSCSCSQTFSLPLNT